MVYSVIAAVVLVIVGIAGFPMVRTLLAEQKKKQAQKRAPRRIRLSSADIAAQEAAAAKRRKDQRPKFGRKTFQRQKPTRKMFGWSW